MGRSAAASKRRDPPPSVRDEVLREAGYKCVWTPFAELYHHESKTRGYEDTPEKQARAAREVSAIKQRWGEKLKSDPFYSRNLSLWDEKSSYTIGL